MICNKCGAEIKDTLKFCNKCGAKIQHIKGAEPPRTEPSAIVEQTNNVVISSSEASSPTLGQRVDSDVIKAPTAPVQLEVDSEAAIVSPAPLENREFRQNENDVVSNPSQPKISRISISDAPETPNTSAAATSSEPKSKMLAGILAIFLGFIGVQWFYLGRKSRGIVYIAISFLMFYILPFLLEFFILFYVGEGIFFIVSSRPTFEKYTMRKQ